MYTGVLIVLLLLCACGGGVSLEKPTPTPSPTATKGTTVTPIETPTPIATVPQQQIELSKSRIHETNPKLVTQNYDLSIIVGAPLSNIRSSSHRGDYEIDSAAFLNEAP